MADYMSNLGTGASTGATVGTAIAPGIGTAIGAGVGALGGLALGVIQNRQAKKQMEEDMRNRPTYQIPSEVKGMMTMAEQQALEGLPEAQKQQYISNLQRSAGYSLSQLANRKAGLTGIAAVNENLNQGYANLMAQDAAARMQRQQNVYGQMQNMANYKDQAFQLNRLNPYYEGIARRNAQQGALYQNINSALTMAPYVGLGIDGMRRVGAGQVAAPNQMAPQSAPNQMAPQSAPMLNANAVNTQGQDIFASPYVNTNAAIPMTNTPAMNAMPNFTAAPPMQQSVQSAFPVGNFYNQSPYTPYQR